MPDSPDASDHLRQRAVSDGHADLDERFEDDRLDLDVWVPYYLAHWSSRAAAAATWDVADGALRLTIPPEQGLWCADLHEPPMRVSCLQSASFSGPLGSPDGPQPFREGLLVREAQPTLWGYTPTRGRFAVRMRATVDEASMFAFWLSGVEDRPERSGEICVAEIFGSDIRGRLVDVGMGIHRFRDPALTEAFTKVALELDTTQEHEYGVDWSEGQVVFEVDGRAVHRVDQSPAYRMQLMIGVFDFPARRDAGARPFAPELVVTHVLGHGARGATGGR